MKLVIFISGHGVLYTENASYNTPPGTIFLCPPGIKTRHQANAQDHVEYFNLFFLEEFLKIGNIDLAQSEEYKTLKKIADKKIGSFPQIFHIDSNLQDAVNHMAQDFITRRIFQKHNWRSYCTSLFFYIFNRILSDYHSYPAEMNSPDTRIEKIARYIEVNCSHNFSLQVLAKKFALSPSSLSHLFKKVKGIPPIEYAINCRIQKSVHMFSYCKDINKIALECGFTDLPYFTRVFRKRLGITPGQFKLLSYKERDMYSSKL